MFRINLNKEWALRSEEMSCGTDQAFLIQCKEEEWVCCDLPCDIHMPLISNGIIEEPLVKDNFLACQWTEEKSWWFKKEIIIDGEILNNDIIELTCNGLDAEADIFLNGIHIARHRSSFYPFIMNVKRLFKIGKNILLIRVTIGTEYISEYDISGIKRFVITEKSHNRGDVKRPHIRKPQYVFGWDWAPRLVTCGIMGDVNLVLHKEFEIRDVRAFTISAGKDAEIGSDVELENLSPFRTIDVTVVFEVLFENQQVVYQEKDVLLRSGVNYVNIHAIIKEAKLWWPNGMGEQSLYTIKVSAIYKSEERRYPAFKFGIRTISLEHRKLSGNQREFTFKVNGEVVFCKGSNWIPADSIYARVNNDKYITLLHEAREANFNMMRIWGGGIYERDIFYEKCDEYGLLVWHDFMFACSLYPDNQEWYYLEVEKELHYQTRRLRNHPCMALWCGNNEIHWLYDAIWKNEGDHIFLGGAKIFNELAPGIIQNNCKEIPYWNGSPYGGENPNGNEIGDKHHWFECIMNEDPEKRVTPQEYDNISAKFVSEFGYIGTCRMSSVQKYCGELPVNTDEKMWTVHTNTHEKGIVAEGIRKHYTTDKNLDIKEYLLYGGLCQGMMLGYAIESMRFSKNCSGSLFWMYNDCWGETGWSIIDYYMTRKIAYYFVKRAFEPLKLIMRESDGIISVTGINDTAMKVKFQAEYGYITFDGNESDKHIAEFTLEPFTRNIILEMNKEEIDFTRSIYYIKPSDTNTIRAAILKMKNIRELEIPKSNLFISDIRTEEGTVKLTITANTYVHAVHFNLKENIKPSDEFFDLLPGESREISIYDATEEILNNVDDIKVDGIFL